MRKFIKIKTDKGFHILPVDKIKYISHLNERDDNYKTCILLIHDEQDEDEFWSTESQEEIFEKLEHGH